jgi:hypothetical protein
MAVEHAMPGTFVAGAMAIASREMHGFIRLLDQVPVVDAGLLVLAAGIAAGHLAMRAPVCSSPAIASAAMLSALAFCGISFASLSDAAPAAFSAHRYALPALPLMIAAIPIVVCEALRRWLPARAATVGRIALPALLILSVVIDAPTRYRQLANDALNVDEVQVAMGRVLGRGPAGQVVWVPAGGGALRYFGRANVIVLSTGIARAAPGAAPLLDAPRPHFVEVVPHRSSLDGRGARGFPAMSFRTTTPDTVDGTPDVLHQRWLVACSDPSATQHLQVQGQVLAFRCSERQAMAASAAESTGEARAHRRDGGIR